MTSRPTKVLAISSGGGHWIQLLRLRPAFEGCYVTYATVRIGYRNDVGDAEFRLIHSANRWHIISLLRSAFGIMRLIVVIRPDIVITTGAAPGYFAARFGKWFGARVIWVDSIANAQELSLSGRKAGKFVDLWVTQWMHLARKNGPFFIGSVL